MHKCQWDFLDSSFFFLPVSNDVLLVQRYKCPLCNELMTKITQPSKKEMDKIKGEKGSVKND